ncbi:MAG: hypothetical protein QXT73_00515 [Candidatus Methanomethylicaceae archaeon]
MNRPQRNFNPGNIKQLKKTPWKGSDGQDQDGFAIFKAPFWGWRALVREIESEIEKNPEVTVKEFIYQYAPPHENVTLAYMMFVCSKTTVGHERKPCFPGTRLADCNLGQLIEAIATYEGWYAKS